MIRFSKKNKTLASRKEKDGLWVRISPGVYVDDPARPVDDQIREDFAALIRHYQLDGRLAYRSGLPGMMEKILDAKESLDEKDKNILFVNSTDGSRRIGGFHFKKYKGSPVELMQDHTVPWFASIRRPSAIRSFLENSSVRPHDRKKVCSSQELRNAVHVYVEKRLSKYMSHDDEKKKIFQDIHDVSSVFGYDEEAKNVWKIVESYIKSRKNHDPYDFRQTLNFNNLHENIKKSELRFNDAKPFNLNFFEAYFSNYIEGTRLSLEDARGILEHHPAIIPAHRDEHDVLSTYNLTKKSPVVWSSFSDFEDFILSTHASLFSHRKDEISAGQYKTRSNRVGSTEFVHPDFVRGTLKKVFDLFQKMEDPSQSAVFLSTAFVCVHPFEDGNGRMSRLILNNILSQNKLERLIVPNVFREDYLLSLEAWSHQQDSQPLAKFWQKMSRISNEVNWSLSLDDITKELERKNAFSEKGLWGGRNITHLP